MVLLLNVKLSNPTTAIRERTGMGVPEFARALGFSAAYVYRMEEDANPGVSKKFALRVAELFPREMEEVSVTVEDLLRGVMSATTDESPPAEEQGAA